MAKKRYHHSPPPPLYTTITKKKNQKKANKFLRRAQRTQCCRVTVVDADVDTDAKAVADALIYYAFYGLSVN